MQKEKRMQGVVYLLLIVCLVMTLVACTGSKKDGDTQGKTKTQKNEISLAKAYKEIPMDLSFMKEEGWVLSVLDVQEWEDRFYILADRKKDSEHKITLFSVNREGLEPQTLELETSVSGADFKNMSSVIGADGCVYVLRKIEVENPKFFLCKWNINGTLEGEFDLTDQTDDDTWKNAATLLVDSESPFLIFGTPNDIKFLRIDKDGKPSATANIEGVNGGHENFFVDNRDRLCTVLVNQETNTWQISIFNSDLSLQEEKLLPKSFIYSFDTKAEFEMLGEKQLLIANEQNLSGYKWGNDEADSLIDFELSEHFVMTWKGIFVENDGTIYGAYVNDVNEFCFNRFSELTQEDMIRIAWLPTGDTIEKSLFKKWVVDFNKSHQDCKIVLDSYGLPLTDPDYSDPNFDYVTYYDNFNKAYREGLDKLNADIAAGNAPDIFCCDGMELEPYIKKGMIADIGELMAQDEEISKIEYLDNVFEACKINGKLYMVIPTFTVTTVWGRRSVVGDRTHWTIEEMMELIDSREGVTEVFGETLTQSNFLRYCYIFNSDHYVDKTTGQCYFESDEFKKMMEFAKNRLSAEVNPEEIGPILDQYVAGKYLLWLETIADFGFTINTWNTIFKEPVTYMGFPTSGECGSVIQPKNILVINEKSSHKKEAWEFARLFLKDKWQLEQPYSFPVLRQLFLTRAEEVYQDVKNGHYYFALSKDIKDDIKIEQAPREEWENYLEFLQSVNYSIVNVDSQIINIIDEESQPYLAGFRDLDETASIIQNRVTLYLQENR